MSRRLLVTVALACVAAAGLRLATRSLTPFSWDPANFALALERIDIAAHQPHPPAAIGYVVAGRLFLALTADANLALILVNVSFTALGGLLVFAIAYHASSGERARCGWLALVALLSSPLFWFYGCVAEVYVPETSLGLLVAYACLRVLQGRDDHAPLAGAALALLGAFRVTGAIFLLPLFAATLVKTGRARPARRAIAVLLLATALWAIPFLLWTGPITYFRVLVDHFSRTAEPTSIFTSGSGRIFNRHLRDAVYGLASGVGFFNVAALPLFVALRRPRLRLAQGLAGFAALWAVPGLAFYLVVHMAKFGYVLPAVPVACLALAFFYAQEKSRAIRLALIAGQLVAGAWQFLLAEPARGAAVGEGLRYSEKSLAQKARVELDSALQATRAAITSADREMQALQQELESACPQAPGVVLVARDGAGPNWRKLMYLFPQAVSVRLPATPETPWMTARDRRLTVVSGKALSLDESCRTFWVDPTPEVVRAVEQSARWQRTDTKALGLYWSRGPTSVNLPGDRTLEIR